MDRRELLQALASTSALAACRPEAALERTDDETADDLRERAPSSAAGIAPSERPKKTPTVVRRIVPIASPFPTLDPFLFCAHHNDAYPRGNAELGPQASLRGRQMGSDFSGRDGFSMYHGEVVPGFPEHPHRGFETITVVREGLVDHSDSLGAAARYGNGDVQWLTAGGGIVHAEMFPLLEDEKNNPLNLFQIWLNLPRRDKFVPPYFSMFWADQVPRFIQADANGRKTKVTVVAGLLGDQRPPAPPPHSWAARPQSDILIAVLEFEPEAEFRLPPAAAGTNRMLYVTRGGEMSIEGQAVAVSHAAEVADTAPLTLRCGQTPTEVLVLQGRPIGEPVAKRGPFVMNTPQEIREAYVDYQATGFGGWPWPSRDPIHGRDRTRFARHADGRTEKAG